MGLVRRMRRGHALRTRLLRVAMWVMRMRRLMTRMMRYEAMSSTGALWLRMRILIQQGTVDDDGDVDS